MHIAINADTTSKKKKKKKRKKPPLKKEENSIFMTLFSIVEES